MPFRGTPHKLTDEDRKKGREKKTKRRSIASSINARKYCDQKCPIWNECAYKVFSDRKYKGKCAFNSIPSEQKRTYLDIINKGDEGLKMHVAKYISRMINLNEEDVNSVKDMGIIVRSANDYAKTFYGTKLKMETTEPIKYIVEFRDNWEKKNGHKAQGKTSKKRPPADKTGKKKS